MGRKKAVHIPFPLMGLFALASGLLCTFTLGHWWGMAAGIALGYGIVEILKWIRMEGEYGN